MRSIFQEIASMRGEGRIAIDRTNSNRYRIVLLENDGSKTAYYFSTPIYQQNTGRLIDPRFVSKDGEALLTGSNTDIRVGKSLWMTNAAGKCEVKLNLKGLHFEEDCLSCGDIKVLPTTNGAAIMSWGGLLFELEVDNSFLNVRSNDKYFALMNGDLRPFVVLSCIGVVIEDRYVIAPAEVSFEKISGQRYQLAVSPLDQCDGWVLFEINLYEPKLWQDTTVESNHPTSNNVFGGVGFIGETSAYGEQWLYSRLDQSKTPELLSKEINRAVLHSPLLSKESAALMAQSVSFRFCSVGSTWDNKVSPSGWRADVAANSTFLSLDISTLITNPRTRLLAPSDGFVLKGKTGAVGATVISTADSYFAPQILEVNYK